MFRYYALQLKICQIRNCVFYNLQIKAVLHQSFMSTTIFSQPLMNLNCFGLSHIGFTEYAQANVEGFLPNILNISRVQGSGTNHRVFVYGVVQPALIVFLTLVLCEMLFEISMTDKTLQGNRLSSIKNPAHFL